MIKETLTLFLAHQQQTLEHEESLTRNNESLGQTHNEHSLEMAAKSEAERESHAAQIVQVRSIVRSHFSLIVKFSDPLRLIGVVTKFVLKINELIIRLFPFSNEFAPIIQQIRRH